MSLLSSQMALEDVGAQLLDNWFLTADPMGPCLDQDEEDDLSPSLSFSSSHSYSGGEVAAWPPLSLANSSASSLSPSSSFSLSPSPSHLSSDFLPPSPPPSFLGSSKAGSGVEDHLMSLTPWLDASELLDDRMGTNGCRDDAFSGMDWMAEKIDLSNFDLDSLIGSCCSDTPPSSPEELLASLETHMDLDLVDPFNAPVPHEVLSLGIPLADQHPLVLPSLELPEEDVKDEVRGPVVTAQDQEVVVKSEPQSPAPLSPAPLSLGYTLELGSEVDVEVLEVKTTNTPNTIIQEPSLQTTAPIILSPSGHFVVVLSPKEEPTILPTSTLSPSASSSCDDLSDDSDSGIDSVSGSPPRHPSSSPSPSPSIAGSSRTKPYSKPDPETTSPTTLSGKVKSLSGAPRIVEKKLKKMEQNKTAATRYRQKKKGEQEVLSGECSELEQRNRELAEKADSISREIQYLRDLMEEVRSAKNRKKTTVSVA